jgi:broad specificity phosphatase PhoE
MSDRVRGSSQVPLSPLGKVQVDELGRRIAAKGGVHSIISSDMDRAADTAKAIQKHNPKADIHEVTPELHAWRMGGHEGKSTEEVLPQILHKIEFHPDEPAAVGTGPLSTKPGESFNEFRLRSLKKMKSFIDDNADPDAKDLATVHYRNIRLLESWIKNGAPDDLSIDTKEMLKKGDSGPGDLFHVSSNGKGLQIAKVNLANNDPLKPGKYFARHGLTEWNGENGAKSEDQTQDKPPQLPAQNSQP